MRWFVVLVALVACKQAPPDALAEKRSVHPDLHCSEGTIDAGRAPPDGHEVWCHAGRPDGSWVRQGPSISWHGNEQRSSIGEYASDKRTGDWIFYYPNAQIEKQGSFVGGVENGVWTHFYPSGQRKSEGTMIDGKEHGPWSYWEEDGRFTAGLWSLGEKDAIWTEHDPDGTPTSERIFKNGRLIGMREL